jgi:hypothetical protein
MFVVQRSRVWIKRYNSIQFIVLLSQNKKKKSKTRRHLGWDHLFYSMWGQFIIYTYSQHKLFHSDQQLNNIPNSRTKNQKTTAKQVHSTGTSLQTSQHVNFLSLPNIFYSSINIKNFFEVHTHTHTHTHMYAQLKTCTPTPPYISIMFNCFSDGLFFKYRWWIRRNGCEFTKYTELRTTLSRLQVGEKQCDKTIIPFLTLLPSSTVPSLWSSQEWEPTV